MDNTHIILHVGLHKTATTFLQRRVFPQVAGHYVPHTDIMPFLVAVCAEDLLGFDAPAWRAYWQGRLRPGLNIISAEALSGNPFGLYANRYDAALKLKAVFPEARVIVGIRGQEGMLLALYRQYVKMGGTKSLAAFAGEPDYRHPAVYAHAYNRLPLRALAYGPYLGHLAELFGQNGVYAYPYEQLSASPQAFLEGLCGFMGVAAPALSFERVNASLPDAFFPLLRRLNWWQRSYLSEKGLFAKLPHGALETLARFFPKDKRLSAKPLLLPYKDYLHADNAALSARFGLDLHGQYAPHYV